MTSLLDELEAAFLVREVLPQGPPGRQGDKGDKGDLGRQGVKGDDGKDADPLDVPQPAETVAEATRFGLKPKVGRRNGRYALELHLHGTPPAPPTSITRVGGGGIRVQDEGVNQGGAGTLNFVGAGVSVSTVNGVTTITIGGGSQVFDDYLAGEVLADQTGAGGVLTFTFSEEHQLVMLESAGDGLTARADAFGGTPTATFGVRLDHQSPKYLPVATTSVKVFAPVGTIISCSGFRRAV